MFLKRKWVSPRISVRDLKMLSNSLRKPHHLLPRAALIYNFFFPEPFNQMAKEEMPKNRVCNRWWTSFEVHKEAVSTVTSPIPPHWHSHTWNIWMVSRGCVCSGDAEPTLHWSQRPCRSLGTCEGEYLMVCSKTGRQWHRHLVTKENMGQHWLWIFFLSELGRLFSCSERLN